MKYKQLIFLCIIFYMPASVWAVSSCVKLNQSTVCKTIWDDYNRSDASVDCEGTVIRLMGMCTNNTGTTDVSVRDYLSTSTTLTNNYRCWCMMAEPVPSRWVLRAVYENASDCRRQCNIGCKNAFLYDNDVDKLFRKTIMSNLIQ